METKQIKEKINRMMQAKKLSPDQAVELMASVMSLVEVRALADDLTAAVVDKALSEIEEGKLTVEKSLELFEELRARAEKEEAQKAQDRKPDEREDWSQAVEDFGTAVRGLTGQALDHARDQMELAREKLERNQDKIKRKLKEKGFGKVDGDVAQDHYTANAAAAITGDLNTLTTTVLGALTLGGDLVAKESLKVNGRLDCKGSIDAGDTDIHGAAYSGGDLKCGDLSVVGALRCGGDMQTGEIGVSGKTQCDGDMTTDKIKVSGKLSCGGDMTAGDVHLSGKIECKGDMTGGRVYVNGRLLVEGDMCIGALQVKEPNEWLEWLSGGLIKDVDQVVCKGDLHADTVEAVGRMVVDGKASFKKGSIEYLKAKRVVLGPGVKAAYVEYRDEMVLGEGAEVQEQVQVS